MLTVQTIVAKFQSYKLLNIRSDNAYYVLHNPTVIDCGESLGTDPRMLHILPARGCPYNSGSAYIFTILCPLDAFAIANHIAIAYFTASESPSNHF